MSLTPGVTFLRSYLCISGLYLKVQDISLTEYKIQRRRLALAEAPRQQKHRLHHDPVSAIQGLVHQHQKLLSVLESQALSYQLDSSVQ